MDDSRKNYLRAKGVYTKRLNKPAINEVEIKKADYLAFQSKKMTMADLMKKYRATRGQIQGEINLMKDHERNNPKVFATFEAYEIGTDEYTNHTKKMTPGQSEARKSKDGEEDMEHIVIQLRKVLNLRGEKIVKFANGDKVKLSQQDARKMLDKMDKLRMGVDKHKMTIRIGKSHAEFKKALKEEVQGKQLVHHGETTKNFDMCPSALKAFADNQKDGMGDKEGFHDAVVAVDKYLGIEKDLVSKGTATEADMEKMMAAVNDAKDKIKDVGLSGHEYHQVHIDAVKELMEMDLDEDKMSKAQMKKREEVAKAIEKDNPDMPMDKKMAIATSVAQKSVKEATYRVEIEGEGVATVSARTEKEAEAKAYRKMGLRNVRNIKGLKPKSKITKESKDFFEIRYSLMEKADPQKVIEFGKDLEQYSKKQGGIDKKYFMKIAKIAQKGKLPTKREIEDADTEPRELVYVMMFGAFGDKFMEKEYKVRMR